MDSYPIKLRKTGRWLMWCDDRWYETSPMIQTKFPLDIAKDIVRKLKRHYVFDAEIVGYEEEKVEEPEHHSIPIKKNKGLFSITGSTVMKMMCLL